MTELERKKHEAIRALKVLCAKCKEENMHHCRVGKLIDEIQGLHGIPVMVNENLYHVVFN